MKIIVLGILIFCVSCGFSSDEETDETKQGIQAYRSDDIDGDLIKDKVEEKYGLDENIADLVKLEVKFDQGYKIEVNLNEKEELKTIMFEERTSFDDADFSYAYGESLLSRKAFKESARVARFNGHSYGEISDFDLNKSIYPLSNKLYRLKNELILKSKLGSPEVVFNNANITIGVNVFLNKHPYIKEIRNPILNIHYFDNKNRKYELLKEEKIERVFKEGVLESIELRIDNIPEDLLFENYFKKGEFLVVSVKDFEIPSLNSNYKSQIASVKSKTTTVKVFTPNSQAQYYVASKNNKSIVEILEASFKGEFNISDNKLIKLGEFENNLPEYEYLSEVANERKKGKWFVYTNKLNQHYLNYSYTPSDTITLSYITGSKLARQVSSLDRSYKEVLSNENAINFIGEINRNSMLGFLIDSKDYWGEEIVYDKTEFWTGRCKGNCRVSQYHCYIDIRHFKGGEKRGPVEIDRDINFFKLKIGDVVYNLSTLINEGVVQKEVVDSFHYFKIVKMNYFFNEEDSLSKEVYLYTPTSKEMSFNGFKLVKMRGKTAHYECPAILTNFAGHNKVPLSVQSLNFNKWKHTVNWNKVIRGDDREIIKDFNFNVTSEVINFYN